MRRPAGYGRPGGQVLAGPLDIPVGRLVRVADPFGNPLVLIDLSRGTFTTDADANVTGNEPGGL